MSFLKITKRWNDIWKVLLSSIQAMLTCSIDTIVKFIFFWIAIFFIRNFHFWSKDQCLKLHHDIKIMCSCYQKGKFFFAEIYCRGNEEISICKCKFDKTSLSSLFHFLWIMSGIFISFVRVSYYHTRHSYTLSHMYTQFCLFMM